MATSKSAALATDNLEASKILRIAKIKNDELTELYEYRDSEVEELAEEIINKYINNEDVLLGEVSDHIQIQHVLANSQRYLSRVTEIYAKSYKILSRLKAAQTMLHNSILPLIEGGTADTRLAKASDITSNILYMIALEEGLINICETAMKHLKTSQEIASRTLKAIEMDLTFFNGSETLSKIVQKTRSKFYKVVDED